MVSIAESCDYRLQIFRFDLRQIFHPGKLGQQAGVISQLRLQDLQFLAELLALFGRSKSAVLAFAVPFGGKWPHHLVEYHDGNFGKLNTGAAVCFESFSCDAKQSVNAIQRGLFHAVFVR